MKIRFNKKGTMCFTEILIMVISVFAFSYLVAMATDSISLVNADVAVNCCPLTKENQVCQEIPYTNCSDECSTSCQYSRCNDVAECELGCCVDVSQGNCVPNTPLTSCPSPNEWKKSASCVSTQGINLDICKPGCCVLGAKTAFVNSKRCEVLTLLNGVSEYKFNQGLTEAQCIGMERSITKGACLFISDEVNCKMLTKEQFVSQSESYSNFYENYLCTSPDLNTTCFPTTQTTCVDEKDQVYFLDSCNNIANIYDSSKIYDPSDNLSVEYWTRVFSIDDSCNSNPGNINSASCGNCDYLQGSRCGSSSKSNVNPDYGEFYCKDLNCYDVPLAINSKGEILSEGDKKHGEQWCIYETLIGETTQEVDLGYSIPNIILNIFRQKIVHTTLSGTDPVGSRHYIATCYNGEFSISPCDEYRNKICVQGEVEDEEGEIFTSASCRLNSWQECLAYNSQIDDDIEGYTTDDMMQACLENPDCYVKQIDIDKYFKFPYCLPKYKPGFDLTNKEGDSKTVCLIASQTCEVIYVKHLDGWDCEENCHCESKEFTLKMNEWCRSLGDCGAQVNVAGEVTTGGFRVKRAPAITIADIKNLNFEDFVNPEIGKYASPGNITYFFSKTGIPVEMAQPENLLSDGFMGGIIGGAGIIYGLLSIANLPVGMSALGILALPIAESSSLTLGIGSKVMIPIPYLQSAFAALAGAAIGYMLAVGFGLDQETAIAVAVVGAVVALYGLANWGWSVPWVAGVAAVLAILFSILGIGDTKSKYVTATCLPYERPAGGDDCDLCNQNELLPCNRYKCTSLGAACKYINEGKSNAKCIASVNDNSAPVISPLKFEDNYTYNILTNGYEIKNKNNDCFDAWENVNIGITTGDKVSQCKISSVAPTITTTFDNMPDYFPDTSYDNNHTMMFRLPSADLLGAIGFDPSRTEQMNFYIRCQDDWKNKNPVDYVIRTCVKPEDDNAAPRIERFSPTVENAYLGFEKTNFPLTIYTNEPAECKYSFSNLDYSEMENDFACGGNYNIVPINEISINNNTEVEINYSEIEQTPNDVLLAYLSKQTMFGFPCYTDVNIKSKNSTIFIKCKDQPWYSPNNETLRNSNLQPNPIEGYKIKLSSSPLNISNILPKGKIMGGTVPFVVELSAETSGGADGKASCSFSFNDDYFSLFRNTGSSYHTTSLNQMITGDYYPKIKCVDVAGNIALGETSFFLGLDTTAPRVIRAYSSSGTLTLITNEDAECAYSTSTCNFLYSNGTTIGGYGTIHTSSISSGKTYYIKCKDLYNNLPSGCSIKVSRV